MLSTIKDIPQRIILLYLSFEFIFCDFSIAIGREGGVAPLIAVARSADVGSIALCSVRRTVIRTLI